MTDTLHSALRALAEEWESGDKTALTDYVEGVNDMMQTAARRLRALLARFPEKPGLAAALEVARDRVYPEIEKAKGGMYYRGWHAALDCLEQVLSRPAEARGEDDLNVDKKTKRKNNIIS